MTADSVESEGSRPLSKHVRTGTRLLVTMGGLCFTALCISGYLAFSALTSTDVAGCGAGEVVDCGHVLNSSYSKILGIPVSVPAVGLYLTLLSVLWFCRTGVPAQIRSAAWMVMAIGSAAAAGAAVWFISLQIIELGHICPWCLGTHACGILLFTIVLLNRPIVRSRMTACASAGAALALGLIGTQFWFPTPTFQIEEHIDITQTAGPENGAAAGAELFEAPGDVFAPPTVVFEAPDVFEAPAPPPAADSAAGSTVNAEETDSSGGDEGSAVTASVLTIIPPRLWFMSRMLVLADESDESTSEESAASDQSGQKRPERRVSFSGNSITLNAPDWPMVGSCSAKHVFVEMFDYTCPHCRNTHRTMKQAFEILGDDVALVALPVPLDRKCNDAASGSGGIHANACEIARIAIALWRVSPPKFHEFHDWLFEGGANQSVTQITAKAESIVGHEALQAELKLPHAASYIAKHVELYKRVGRGSVPKLLFPTTTLTGEVNSASVLCDTIRSKAN